MTVGHRCADAGSWAIAALEQTKIGTHMSDMKRQTFRDTRKLLTIGALCTVLWFAIASIFRAEQGLGADITWLVSTLVMVAGLVAFVLAATAAVRNRR